VGGGHQRHPFTHAGCDRVADANISGIPHAVTKGVVTKSVTTDLSDLKSSQRYRGFAVHKFVDGRATVIDMAKELVRKEAVRTEVRTDT
jgi:hypothetical protein